MEKLTKRPFLLAGLIINIVAFAIYIIDCILIIFTLASAMSSAGGTIDETIQAAVVLVMLITILLLAFCITGVVFSAVCIPRYTLSPEKFSKKKGLIMTTFIFDVVVVLLSIIGFCSGSFSVLGIIIVLALIAAAVFIMIDYSKNSKLLAKEKEEQQKNETVNSTEVSKETVEVQSEEKKEE